MKVIIVDDEQPAIDFLKMQLEQINEVEVVGEYSDALIVATEVERLNPDLVFLDIELPEINGIELARHILEIDETIGIVFVTSYDNYALEAFQVNAMDYLMKPVTPKEMEACIRKVRRFRQEDQVIQEIEATYSINCFGNFIVESPIGKVKWPTRKAEELFAYFCLNSTEILHVSVLGEILWQEADVKKVKSKVHTEVYRIRKTIKKYELPIRINSIKGGYGDYKIDFGTMNSDLFIVSPLVGQQYDNEQQPHIRLGIIFDSYTGKLLEDKDYLWCEHYREWYHQRCLQEMKKTIQYNIDKGDLEKAYEQVQKARLLEYLDENIHFYELTLLAKNGNRKRMLECHNKYIKAYVEELGIEPPEVYNEIINE